MSVATDMNFRGSVPRAKKNFLLLVRVLSGYLAGEFAYPGLPEDTVNYDGEGITLKNIKWQDLDGLVAASGQSFALGSKRGKSDPQAVINEVFKFLGAKNNDKQLIFRDIYTGKTVRNGRRNFSLSLPKSVLLSEGEAIKQNELWLDQKIDELSGVEQNLSEELDWRRLCQEMFERQRTAFKQRRELLDRRELSVFVPLGLVQPKPEKKINVPQTSWEGCRGRSNSRRNRSKRLLSMMLF